MISPELTTLGTYLAGEFDNQQQALAQPAWFVHLRLWVRPVPIFTEDSITLFAEQANIVNLERPYRPRILRLRQRENIEVEYYAFKDIERVKGAGLNRNLLQQINPEYLEFLPNCTLQVTTVKTNNSQYSFTTIPVSETPCTFSYQGNIFQVFLGFLARSQTLETYDKGIDPTTGKAIWGALMGGYCFTKRQDFSDELII
jgi:CpeT/CpcT family (DUF1001)